MVIAFLETIRTILAQEDPAIIRWNKTGNGIEIRNQHRLVSEIMPRYFRHQNYVRPASCECIHL